MSRILKEVLKTAKGLFRTGVMDAATLEEFEDMELDQRLEESTKLMDRAAVVIYQLRKELAACKKQQQLDEKLWKSMVAKNRSTIDRTYGHEEK